MTYNPLFDWRARKLRWDGAGIKEVNFFDEYAKLAYISLIEEVKSEYRKWYNT